MLVSQADSRGNTGRRPANLSWPLAASSPSAASLYPPLPLSVGACISTTKVGTGAGRQRRVEGQGRDAGTRGADSGEPAGVIREPVGDHPAVGGRPCSSARQKSSSGTCLVHTIAPHLSGAALARATCAGPCLPLTRLPRAYLHGRHGYAQGACLSHYHSLSQSETCASSSPAAAACA